jgi:threonyl-tRNA synthetase
LTQHLERLEEAERRDHRLLGKQLDLYHIDEEVGAGLPLWHPKGALVRKIIEDFWREAHLANGYEMVMIPHIASVELWKTSGHWDFYRENMYSPMDIEGQEYIVKPMNCPGHIKIYKSRTRSYRELPIRWAELGTVYRYERSGVLHGLLRVRGFTQDDAHLFCRPDQLEDEILGVIKFVLYMLGTFGFDEYEVYLSTRPEKSVGSDEHWQQATEALKTSLEKSGLKYEIDPGEGVFYGPKIDMKIRDALGRAWQCTTIQVDFNLPERFDVTYVGEDNKEHRPIMIHRALLGSLERFMGCLIEHYAGAFPLWLAPVQVAILPIADRHRDYAKQVASLLTKYGIRVELDYRRECVGKKMRDAEVNKIPYMLCLLHI